MKAWIASFLAGIAAALLAVFSWHGTHAVSHVAVDSTRVATVRDSLAPAWARERDSLRRWADSLRAAPPATVWRVLRQAIHDTDTGRLGHGPGRARGAGGSIRVPACCRLPARGTVPLW